MGTPNPRASRTPALGERSSGETGAAGGPGGAEERVVGGTRTGSAVALAVLLLGPLAGCAGPAPATATPADRSTPAALSPSAVPMTPPAVVVLDPGHNGGNAAAPEEVNRPVPAGGFTKPCNTTGAATDVGYPEHAFTLDTAQRAAGLLRAEGVTVLLTRADDTGVGPCVDARAAVANEVDADLALSIHADGAAADVRGFHVIEPDVAPD